MRKTALFLILSLLASSLFTGSVFAQEETTPTPTQTPKRQLIKEKVGERVQQKKQEFQETTKEKRKNLLQNVKDKLRKRFAKAVLGEVTGISGSTLTVKTRDGATITILTDENTRFVRNYWGHVSLADILVGHRIVVFGRFTDDSRTTIQARLIRDQSLQKRHGVMFGEVISKADGSVVIKTQNRGDQTVVFDSSTKFINRRNQSITQADILVGHRVRIKGLWDKSTKTLTQVREVKDFSIPQKEE